MAQKKLKSVLRWIGWIFLVQFILINISAAFYADKFTHLYTPEEEEVVLKEGYAKNIFAKTWRLFTGYRFYKHAETEVPPFGYTTVHLWTKNKIQIEAWYAKADSFVKGTVILLHGLMGNKSLVLEEAKQFLYSGYNVLMLDTRGHGNSGGHTTSFGFHEAEEVKLAYDYVQGKGEKRIYLWGISMGAVEIIKAVADYNLPASGLILEMPFGSLQDHIKARIGNMGFPKQPFSFLVTFWIGVEKGFNGLGYTLDDYARKIKCPVLLQYGTKDQLVTWKEIDTIFKAFASTNKRLAIYENVHHEFLLQKDPVGWKEEVGRFLEGSK